MSKTLSIAAKISAAGIFAWLLWWLFLPAINIHSVGFWAIFIAATATVALIGTAVSMIIDDELGVMTTTAWILFAIIGIIIFLATMSASAIFKADSYAEIGNAVISDGDFDEDIAVVENGVITDIAIMDTDTASTMGSRAMGSLGTLATQYGLGDFVTLTVSGEILKISPLGYNGLFKWMSEKDTGIPGYVAVDPVSGTSTYVEFSEYMVYSSTAYFSADAYRTIRYAYPTTMTSDIHFEVDEDGHPYWVCATYQATIGLFGGKVVSGTIVLDAVTGEVNKYELDNVPEWVSVVYDANYLIRLVDLAGTYSNGWLNSWTSQKDVFQTTNDYGFKVVDGQLAAFTGVTSAAYDESNMAFVLCNERTGKVTYYTIYGAEEYSAMTAAEGLVLDFGYEASFPSICNVEGSPVYIMALTDDGNLIKKYAMVDLQDYTKVVIGETVEEVWTNFLTKYTDVNLDVEEVTETTTVVENVYETYTTNIVSASLPVLASVNGTSYVYILSEDGYIYQVPVSGNESVLFNIFETGIEYEITIIANGTGDVDYVANLS